MSDGGTPALAITVEGSLPELVGVVANGKLRESLTGEDRHAELAMMLCDDERHQYYYSPYYQEEKSSDGVWQQQVSF